MKALEFYSKAQRDCSFRVQQIDEARYQKKLAVGSTVATGAVWLGYVLYCRAPFFNQ
jgi:hypothetical protein